VRLPRMTTRRWMIAVAVGGLLVGEFVRLRRLSREYTGRAINASRRLGYARMSAAWSHERWLGECQAIDQSNRKYAPFQMGHPLPPELARKRVAYWLPIVSKYERAARCPWLPVEPDPPVPD
jgi:hypothetical protein